MTRMARRTESRHWPGSGHVLVVYVLRCFLSSVSVASGSIQSLVFRAMTIIERAQWVGSPWAYVSVPELTDAPHDIHDIPDRKLVHGCNAIATSSFGTGREQSSKSSSKATS